MLELLGQAALRTLLLATFVQLCLALCRIKRPQLRLTAWTVVLAASLAMPALQWVTPLRLPVLPNLPGAALTGAADPQQQAPVAQASTPIPAEDITALTTTIPWLEALYVLIAGILLLRLTVGIALSLQLLSEAAPVDPDWAAGTDIRVSPKVTAPVTVAHVVLLPSDVVTWSMAMREAVLAHERAHVARWDYAMLLASQVNRALFWFSPLSWWLHRRLASLAELASDDQAIQATGDRPGYAGVLLEMGRRSGPLLQGLAMARPATLIYRIERILSDRTMTNSITPLQQAVLAFGAASLSILAASSGPTPMPPPALRLMAEQMQPPTSADQNPSPSTPAVDESPESAPVRASQPEIASQAPQPVPVTEAATPSYFPAARRAPPSIPRPPTRATPSRVPRSVPQQVSAGQNPGWPDVPPKAGLVVSANSIPRTDQERGIINSIGGTAGPGGQTPLFHRTGQLSSSEPKHVDEPYCTGALLPKPGSPRRDGSVDFVQAKYFQEADGTPWLKLFLGVRTRARLNGFDVDRSSIGTTVLTTLPRDTTHVTGTTHGTYGMIDFECMRPNARL